MKNNIAFSEQSEIERALIEKPYLLELMKNALIYTEEELRLAVAFLSGLKRGKGE
nr:hypothetical protein [uncultured Schaedlerella sp.]